MTGASRSTASEVLCVAADVGDRALRPHGRFLQFPRWAGLPVEHYRRTNPVLAASARHVIAEVLAEHQRAPVGKAGR